MVSVHLQTIVVHGDCGSTSPTSAFHPDGRHLFVANLASGKIVIVDCESGAIVDSFSCPAQVQSLGIDATNKHLLAIVDDRILSWSVSNVRAFPSIVEHNVHFYIETWPPMFAHSGNDTWILFAEAWLKWAPGGIARHPNPVGEYFDALGYSNVGHLVVVASDFNRDRNPKTIASVWDITDWKRKCVFQVPEMVAQVTCNPEISIGVLMRYDAPHMVDVVSLETGKSMSLPLPERPTTIISALFCGAAHLITVECAETRRYDVVAMNVNQGGRRHLVTLPLPPLTASNRTGSSFATVANDGRHPIDQTCFWDPVRGEAIASTTGHFQLSDVAMFSPNGKWFMTAGDEHSAADMTTPLSGGGVVITNMAGIV